jgi:hypothetical protein
MMLIEVTRSFDFALHPLMAMEARRTAMIDTNFVDGAQAQFLPITDGRLRKPGVSQLI